MNSTDKRTAFKNMLTDKTGIALLDLLGRPDQPPSERAEQLGVSISEMRDWVMIRLASGIVPDPDSPSWLKSTVTLEDSFSLAWNLISAEMEIRRLRKMLPESRGKATRE